MQFEKHFSVEEANELIPHVLSVFERVHAIREELAEFEQDLEDIHESSGSNGGSQKGNELIGRSEAIGRLLSGLSDKGIQVKDVNGLVDFPHIREDREVFLCWKMGEQSITHWHDLESGYRGRQPL